MKPPIALAKKIKMSPEEECKNRGWIWNDEKQSCDNPDVQPLPETAEDIIAKRKLSQTLKGGVDPSKSQVFPESIEKREALAAAAEPAYKGQTKKVYTRDGASVMVSRSEAEKLPQEEETLQAQQRQETEVKAQEQERLGEILSHLGEVGKLTAAKEAGINWFQAGTAGMAKLVPGAIGGGVSGLGLGYLGKAATMSTGAGAVAAIGLGAAGFVSGVIGNIKEQQSGELGAAALELSNGEKAMRQMAMMASRDPANADIYVSLSNKALTRVYQAQRQTKMETNDWHEKWMKDGRVELQKFDTFLQEDIGAADVYAQKLRVAVNMGLPLSIKGDELLLDEE